MTFYLTFPYTYPWGNGWIEIQAENKSIARQKAFDTFGRKWSFIYEEKDFDKSFFKKGKIGEIK